MNTHRALRRASGDPARHHHLGNGVTVAATNAVGTGPASAPVTVTPWFTTFSGPSATGTGIITASFTGGDTGCAFDKPAFIGAPPGDSPVPPTAPQATFPHGLFDFRVVGCAPGDALTFTITYPSALPAGTLYFKYGPTAGDPTPHWYVLPAIITGAAATFTITDGGLGDDDLAANGAIVDQGGPGVPDIVGPVPLPTLSAWAMLVMTLLLGMAGLVSLRRRSAVVNWRRP